MDDQDTPSHNGVVWVDGRCTGFLIAPDIVATAGHCLVAPRSAVMGDHMNRGSWIRISDWSSNSITVRVGLDSSRPQFQTQAEAFNQPGLADVILLGLVQPVPGNIAIPFPVVTEEKPIPTSLSPTDFWAAQRFRLAGWGMTERGRPLIRQTALAAKARYPMSSRYRNKILVTGGGEAVVGAGDSGSPLLWTHPATRTEMAIGICQGSQGSQSRYIAAFGQGGRVAAGSLDILAPHVASWMALHSSRSYSAQIERQIWHPARECQTLFAWWSPERRDNFATTQGEWIGGPGDWQEGYRFYARLADVFSADRAAPAGTIPLWSWWSSSGEDNWITAGPEWASNEMDPGTGFPYAFHGCIKDGYRCYRLEGYIYDPDHPQPSGTVALYTYYSSQRRDHHLTTDPDMKHEGIASFARKATLFQRRPGRRMIVYSYSSRAAWELSRSGELEGRSRGLS